MQPPSLPDRQTARIRLAAHRGSGLGVRRGSLPVGAEPRISIPARPTAHAVRTQVASYRAQGVICGAETPCEAGVEHRRRMKRSESYDRSRLRKMSEATKRPADGDGAGTPSFKKQKTDGRMTLYHWYPYRSTRAMWAINEVGKKEDTDVVFINTEPKTDEEKALLENYRASVHPLGTIPALVLETGEVLVESGAICLYLAEKYGKLRPTGDDVQEKVHFLNWFSIATTTLDALLMDLHGLLHGPSAEAKKSEEDEKKLEKAKQKFSKLLKSLDDHLEGKEYIAGGIFTIADLLVAYDLFWARFLDADGSLFKPFDRVNAYVDAMLARDGFKNAGTFENK